MAKERKKIRYAVTALVFVVYFLFAVRSIPRETVLASRWIISLESAPRAADAAAALVPFSLGERFGYVDAGGRFAINRTKKENLSISEKLWAEYDARPESIEVKTSADETAFTIENPRGYPYLADDRVFIVSAEQNAVSEIDRAGAVMWTYEFSAPLTCIDAAGGLLLTGSLDGVVEVLDGEGTRLFFFEPGGSRYAIIQGCAFSRDASRIGIISGVDDQRFLLLERFGAAGEYKVIYHEFLEDGFRRPVFISFIDDDSALVFEREGGIGVYRINARQSAKIALDGDVAAIESSGGQGLFFAVTSRSEEQKQLVGIRLPDTVIMKAPFKSSGVFLDRTGSRLFIGGKTTLAAFELEKK